MDIELTVDYRGVLTDEFFYKAGKYTVPDDMTQAHADALVKAGHAVEAEAGPEPEKPVKKAAPKAKAKPKAKAAPVDVVNKSTTKKG